MDATAETAADTAADAVHAATSSPGVLGLSADTYRILGRAIAEFATRASSGPLDEEDREQAAGLHDALAAWGYVPGTPVDPDNPGGPTLTPVAPTSDDVPHHTPTEDQS